MLDLMHGTEVIDLRLIVSLGVPALIAVISWFFAHWLQTSRERAAKKRDSRIRALEIAYLRLANAANRPLSDKAMDDIETFVSEIQLYGTPRQITLMSKLVEDFKKPNNIVSFDDLLSDLRDTLRQQLKLEPVKGPVWWFRFSRLPRNQQV